MPSTGIEEQCFPVITSLGGAMIRVACRMAQHNERPVLPEGADSMMFAYKAGGAAPESPDECTKTMIISHASFIHAAGVEHLASFLHGFARWYNTKHPHLAGPWSIRASVVLG